MEAPAKPQTRERTWKLVIPGLQGLHPFMIQRRAGHGCSEGGKSKLGQRRLLPTYPRKYRSPQPIENLRRSPPWTRRTISSPLSP